MKIVYPSGKWFDLPGTNVLSKIWIPDHGDVPALDLNPPDGYVIVLDERAVIFADDDKLLYSPFDNALSSDWINSWIFEHRYGWTIEKAFEFTKTHKSSTPPSKILNLNQTRTRE